MRAKLMPTPQQERLLRQWAGQARAVYNAAVEQFGHWEPWRQQRPPGYAEQDQQLTEARAEIDWLGSGSRIVQAQALRDFERARRRFFANPGAVGPPVRRKKHENTFNVVGPTSGLVRYSKRSGAVHIPKIGLVRVRLSKRDYTPALSASSFRVFEDPTGWHVAFVTEYRGREIEPAEERTAVGIDLGITTTVVLSNGQHYRSPYRPAAEERIAALQRRKDAAPHRSAERRRLARRIARAQAREARRRADWREKITTRLVEQHDVIAVEDLRPVAMMRRPRKKQNEDGSFAPNGAAAKSGLNRGLARSGFGAFRARLEQKAARAKSPTQVVRVSARGTSQTCSRCGHCDADNRTTQAEFLCLSCGFHFHADTNAARNTLARAHERALAPAGGLPVPAASTLLDSASGVAA